MIPVVDLLTSSDPTWCLKNRLVLITRPRGHHLKMTELRFPENQRSKNSFIKRTLVTSPSGTFILSRVYLRLSVGRGRQHQSLMADAAGNVHMKKNAWRAACVPLQCVRAGAKRGLPLCARPQQQQQQPDKVFTGSRCADTPRGTRSLRAIVTVSARSPVPRSPRPPLTQPFPRGCLRVLEAFMAPAPSRPCRRGRGAAAARVPVCRSRGRRCGGSASQHAVRPADESPVTG